MGLCNIQNLNEISYQKVQIINLNKVFMIICREANEMDTHTHTQIFTQYSGISSHSKEVVYWASKTELIVQRGSRLSSGCKSCYQSGHYIEFLVFQKVVQLKEWQSKYLEMEIVKESWSINNDLSLSWNSDSKSIVKLLETKENKFTQSQRQSLQNSG